MNVAATITLTIELDDAADPARVQEVVDAYTEYGTFLEGLELAFEGSGLPVTSIHLA